MSRAIHRELRPGMLIEVGVPRNHLHKIVQDLAEAGVVRTLRGARGGVMLACPPTEITLGQVVRWLERDQALVACFRPEGGGACRLAPDCRLRGSLWHARAAFLEVLDRTTLADCLGPASSEETWAVEHPVPAP